MAFVRYSRRAEDDLLDIGRYTLEAWGAEQADRYLSEIEACCQRLAENPEMGRSCGEIRRGLRKMHIGSMLSITGQRLTASGYLASCIREWRLICTV